MVEGTPFVGRAREIEALGQLVGAGARLVTLVGTGGVGKTRVALEWARAAEASLRRDGVGLVLCDLSSARDADGVCEAVARAVGAPLAAGATTDEIVAQVGRALAELDRAVLVLDNVEQIAALTPRLLPPWLSLAPRVQVVATSRERLRLRDEQCLPVEPLGLPPEGASDPSAIAASEAVLLFVARTRRACPGFALTEADAPAVAEVVRALDGIPLAVELCAARMGVLGLRQILSRLRRPLDLLVTGARDAPARHTTLRAALAWSWDLLAPWEQEALAQCSAFEGGFSLDAVEAVIALGAGAPPVVDAIQSLHDKSLVRVHGEAGEPRYGLLESVRDFAREKLAERGGEGAAAARHTAFFVGAEGSPLPRVLDARASARTAADVAAVARRALAERPVTPARADVALRALLLLEPLYLASAEGRLEPYAASLDAALLAASPPIDPAVAARARYVRALADFLRGRLPECFLGFQRALEGARAAGARLYEGLSLTKLALMLEHEDRVEDARRAFDEARAIALELGDPALDGDLMLTRGGALIWQGRAEEAAWHEAEAMERFAQAGDPRSQSMAAALLALARLNQGLYEEGASAAERALVILDAWEEQRTEGYALGVLGRIHQARGRLDEARATLSAALRIHRAVGDRWSEGLHIGYLANVALEERRYGDARAGYGEALEKLRGAGERHYVAIFLAALAAAELPVGARDAALRRFEDAEAALAGVQVSATRVNVDLFRALADVEAARRAAEAGDAEAGARHRGAARARLVRADAPAADGSPPATRCSEDVRFAARMLARELDAGPSPGLRPAEPSGGGGAALVVGPEARWFRREDGEPVSLLKARGARLVLAELLRRRVETPGVALSLDALFEAGWPGERVQRKAAANRVYVALTKLRNLGLRGLIQSRDDGFLLDPGAAVVEALGGEPRAEASLQAPPRK